MQHTLRSLRTGYFQCDMDVREMFLNFVWFNTPLRLYAGVDITHVRDTSEKAPYWERKRDRKWERWSRNFMGLTDLPHRSLQLMINAKFIAYGNSQWSNSIYLAQPITAQHGRGCIKLDWIGTCHVRCTSM